MRTIFDPEEIITFFGKKNNEIGGDNTLNSLMFKDAAQSVDSFQSMLEAIYIIGLKQGQIEGKQAMLMEMIDFFEIEEK